MNKVTTNVSIRIEKDLKTEAEILFEQLGINMSTAFNIFIRQAIREGGIPFSVNIRANKETLAAMIEAEKIAKDPTVKAYSNITELFADLDR